jgi:hypothetical protein
MRKAQATVYAHDMYNQDKMKLIAIKRIKGFVVMTDGKTLEHLAAARLCAVRRDFEVMSRP